MTARAAREKRAIADLAGLAWAKPLLKKILQAPEGPDQGTCFELRFAQEIARSGLTPLHEFKTGVGGSDVDFRIQGSPPWNIELVTVEVSQAVQRATVTSDVGSVRTEEVLLGLVGDEDEEERQARIDAKQTPEQEMLRFISNLEKKVYSSRQGKAIKFPLPSVGAVNMLLADTRFFEGSGFLDRDHCRQMVFQPTDVSDEAFVYWDPVGGRPIRGLWDPANDRPGAVAARERIHVIGFVHEEEYTDDEIREVTVLFSNPHLPVDLSTYPLRWPTAPGNPRTKLRLRNALWNRNAD